MPPVLANYYLTYKCNSRCSYCDIPNKPENVAVKASAPELIIENLVALMRLVSKLSISRAGSRLFTNICPSPACSKRAWASLLALQIRERFIQAAHEIRGLVDDLNFHLSTVDQAEYKKERGIDGWHAVIDSIKLARSLGEHPSIIATATPQSICRHGRVIRLARDLGVAWCLLGRSLIIVKMNSCKRKALRKSNDSQNLTTSASTGLFYSSILMAETK